jgi:cytochrome c oxidase subunit 2
MSRSIGAIVAVALAAIVIVGRHRAAATAPAGAERVKTASAGAAQVIHVTAKRFEYVPSEITLKRGVPVVLEITSADRDHGFKVPELGVRADVKPGETTRVRLVPDKTGRFAFRCDVFCGSGHEDMTGELVVVD